MAVDQVLGQRRKGWRLVFATGVGAVVHEHVVPGVFSQEPFCLEHFLTTVALPRPVHLLPVEMVDKARLVGEATRAGWTGEELHLEMNLEMVF